MDVLGLEIVINDEENGCRFVMTFLNMLAIFASLSKVAILTLSILSQPYFHVCISVSQLVRDIGIAVFARLRH